MTRLPSRTIASRFSLLVLAVAATGRSAHAFEGSFRGELTVAQAVEIGRGRDDWDVCLPELTTLSPEIATALVTGPCYYKLSLPSLTALSTSSGRWRK